MTALIPKLGKTAQRIASLHKMLKELKVNELEEFKGGIESLHYKNSLDSLLKEGIETCRSNKKSVLILDDFDRLDPEHVFRILNVFSATLFDDQGALDEESNQINRWGFDKVIIVGDYRNIKSIFHHKYGQDTEFEGYFDKFTSSHVYDFNNKAAIAEAIPLILDQIKHSNGDALAVNMGSGSIVWPLREVFLQALEIDEINLRQIYKPATVQFNALNKITTIQNVQPTHTMYLQISLQILAGVFMGKEKVLDVLGKTRNRDLSQATRFNQAFATEYIAHCLWENRGEDNISAAIGVRMQELDLLKAYSTPEPLASLQATLDHHYRSDYVLVHKFVCDFLTAFVGML